MIYMCISLPFLTGGAEGKNERGKGWVLQVYPSDYSYHIYSSRESFLRSLEGRNRQLGSIS